MVIGESKSAYLFSKDVSTIDFSSCVASITVSDDVISYGIFDELSSEAVWFERMPLKNDLERELSFPFESGEVSKIHITQCGGQFTLLPNSLEQEKEEVLKEFLNCGESDQISKRQIESINASLFFKSVEALEWLTTKFPNAEVQHNAVFDIENAMVRNRYQKGIKVYADIAENTVQLMVFSDNRLISISVEEYVTESDLFYHITSRIESTHFDQMEDLLYVSGLINQHDDTYTQLSKFVKEIRLNSGFKYQKLNKDLSSVPKHIFFNVINAFQCA